jgi:hypothetical protein
MAMNYEIIKDEKALKDFIDWLPELNQYEKYYLCLFARNKYCKELSHIKSDKSQLKRFVSDKERLYWKIKQLEVEVGAYRQKENPIPQEALALYIAPNPRNTWKATFNSLIKLSACIRDQNISNNPHQEVLSEIQKAKGTTHYIDFDIDEKDETVLADTTAKIKGLVNEDAITWLRTRGGLHVLVNPKKVAQEYKHSFYQGIAKLGNVDQTGDQLIPVVGCTQGNFVPYFAQY